MVQHALQRLKVCTVKIVFLNWQILTELLQKAVDIFSVVWGAYDKHIKQQKTCRQGLQKLTTN